MYVHYHSEERFGVHQLRTRRVRLQPGRAQHERAHDERARDHGERGYPRYLHGSRPSFEFVRLKHTHKRVKYARTRSLYNYVHT